MEYQDMTKEQKEVYKEQHPAADKVYAEIFLNWSKPSPWRTKTYVNKHVDNGENDLPRLIL